MSRQKPPVGKNALERNRAAEVKKFAPGLDSIFEEKNINNDTIINNNSSTETGNNTTTSTDTSTSNNTTHNTNDSNTTDINNTTNDSTNINTITKTIISTNFSTNTITIEKRLKYTEERPQRAYYIKKSVINKLDKFCKKYNIDKSDVVNNALELFFASIENEKGT